MGWERLDDPPEWIVKTASKEREKNPDVVGKYQIHRGDTYVYKIEYGFGNHGHDYTFYRQLKSENFETTRNEGTCPNCQAYVRRMEGDDYLTCHRCGWQYKPITERLRNLLSI